MALHIIILLLLSIPFTVAQTISVTSTLIDRLACPGIVKFTCRVSESHAIAWRSDEYIGRDSGIQLTFEARRHTTGSIRSIGSTIASLTGNDPGNQILESYLWISVHPNSPNGSVTCLNVGDGTTKTIDFEVVADPNMPQDLIAVQFNHVKDPEMCIVTAIWLSPNNTEDSRVIGYDVLANGKFITNQTVLITTANGPRISSLFTVSDGCGAHNISVRAVNICARDLEGRSSHRLNIDEILAIESDDTCSSGTRNGINLLTMILVLVATLNLEFVMIMKSYITMHL